MITNYQQIKAHIDHIVAGGAKDLFVISHEGLRGACINALNSACGSNENRKLLLRALFGKTSSRELTDAEWYALFRFVFQRDEYGNFVFKDAGGRWSGRPELEHWCGIVLEAIADQPGPMKMFEAKDEQEPANAD
jgi:hypothetical protein